MYLQKHHKIHPQYIDRTTPHHTTCQTNISPDSRQSARVPLWGAVCRDTKCLAVFWAWLTDAPEGAAGSREGHHGQVGADVLQGHRQPAHQLRLGAVHGHA